MLGRTANGIYWMFRYLERAENTARLLDAGFRMSLTHSSQRVNEEWRSIIITLGHEAAFKAKYDDYTGSHVFNFVLRDRENPDSILKMIEAARSNARMGRSSITSEVWEATNEGWMTLKELLARPAREGNLGQILAAVRGQSSLVRGATYGTMLRNEIYHFARCGTFIERADNTARILDVKYYLLLPSLAYVGSSLDNSQWDNVLRSLAAGRAYRRLNAGRMESRSIAEFLTLDARFPRSLTFCYEQLQENLSGLARAHGADGTASAIMRDAAAKLRETTIDEVFEMGLHEFLIDFIARNQTVASAIANDYRFTA